MINKFQHVCAVDDVQATALCVSLDSALRHNYEIVERVVVIYLRGMLSCDNQLKIRSIVEKHSTNILFYVVDNRAFEAFTLGSNSHITLSSFLRLFLREAASGGRSRDILYLDADTVVIANLSKLLSLPRKHFYAVDHCEPYEAERLGLYSHYFNAGFFFVRDVDEVMPSHDILIQVYCENKSTIFWHDQDVLNIYFSGLWKELSYRYNVCSRLQNIKTVKNAFILHFDGSNKPWDEKYFHESRSIWFTAYSKAFGKTHCKDKFSSRLRLFFLTIRMRLRLRHLINTLFKVQTEIDEYECE